MPRLSEKFVVKNGYVRKRGWLGFVTSYPKADDQEVSNGQIFCYVNDDWYTWQFAWQGIGMTSTRFPEATLVVLGRDGNALIGLSSGYQEESVEEDGMGPARRGPMRQIRTICDQVIAVGMGRQVYKRSGPNSWVRIEAGLPTSRQSGQVIGFNAVDGFGVDDMYAVGWAGEIWHYNGLQWSRIESPTNLALFDLISADERVLYAGGQAGVLLRGHDTHWDVLDYKGPRLEFRSLAWFRGSLYAADGTSLHVLRDNTFVRVDFGLTQPAPSSHLHVNDGLLLSTAGKEVFTTTDGVTWDAVPV